MFHVLFYIFSSSCEISDILLVNIFLSQIFWLYFSKYIKKMISLMKIVRESLDESLESLNEDWKSKILKVLAGAILVGATSCQKPDWDPPAPSAKDKLQTSIDSVKKVLALAPPGSYIANGVLITPPAVTTTTATPPTTTTATPPTTTTATPTTTFNPNAPVVVTPAGGQKMGISTIVKDTIELTMTNVDFTWFSGFTGGGHGEIKSTITNRSNIPISLLSFRVDAQDPKTGAPINKCVKSDLGLLQPGESKTIRTYLESTTIVYNTTCQPLYKWKIKINNVEKEYAVVFNKIHTEMTVKII